VAYGATLRQAGLDGHVIQPKKLQDIAIKVVSVKRQVGSSSGRAIMNLRDI
jgi:hypothetical protein